ncbi:bifunctional riboflavin kinase/FAD synthetase [Tannockella kyphosi]|uniref:bifunctional riboflavin kinase/FAD synthetase n=1 Tax=Tannockella kyphosi TaxID=2899121 RepID=UPI0020134FDF|nr:bifunctional riboflavin kinase/FAD synthetase [Tannockella kyphosi]
MEIVYLNNKKIKIESCIVALGFFDGMHLGHMALVEKVIFEANLHKHKKALLTFEKSPKSILTTCQENYLTSLEDKAMLLEQKGIDYLFVLPFNKEIASFSPQQFIETYLKNDYMKGFVCGYDFHFGHFGAGNPTMLEAVAPTVVVDKLMLQEHRVSSSFIKQLLKDGEIKKANKFLAYAYCIQGVVIHGKHRGKSQLGFATANVDYKDYVLPKNGVYACVVEYEKQEYFAMTNIGINPTFGDIEKPSLEVHLFGFDEMIYDKIIKVSFQQRIRNEMKFSSLEHLIEQLNNDQKKCIEYFR